LDPKLTFIKTNILQCLQYYELFCHWMSLYQMILIQIVSNWWAINWFGMYKDFKNSVIMCPLGNLN